MKFEKEFRNDNPQTIGETDSHFDLHNYNEWLESKHEQLHSELEKAKELLKELIPMAEDAYKGYVKGGSVHQEMLKEDRDLISKATTFLEGSGNKTK